MQRDLHLQLLLLDAAILKGIVLVDEFDSENGFGGALRSGFLDAIKLSAIAEQLEYGIGHRITRRMLPSQLFVTRVEMGPLMVAGQAANVEFRSSYGDDLAQRCDQPGTRGVLSTHVDLLLILVASWSDFRVVQWVHWLSVDGGL